MKRRDLLKTAALAATPAVFAACAVVPAPQPVVPRPEDAWLERFGIDADVLKHARSALGGRGADFGEIFLQSRHQATTRFANGAAAETGISTESGAGLRSVAGGDTGFVAIDTLNPEGLMNAAERAARGQVVDAVRGPASKALSVADGVRADDDHWGATSEASRRGVLLRLAEKIDRRIDGAADIRIDLDDVDEHVVVASLNGRLVADYRPMLRLTAQVDTTRAGVTHRAFASVAGRHLPGWLSERRLDELVDALVHDADTLFEARRPPGGNLPVLLAAGAGAVLIHEAIGHAFEADEYGSGRSIFAGAMGQRVAAPSVTLADDSTLHGLRGSVAFDDEGIEGQRSEILRDGRLVGLLHDRQSALRTGVASTGNGRRESFRYAPLPRTTTLVVENGSVEPEELLRSMGRGIVAESFAGGAVDPGLGEFRFIVRRGWLIDGGRRRMPIRDFELIGNGAELLQNVAGLANDFRTDDAGWLGRKRGQAVPIAHGMPSMLVTGLQLNPLASS